MALSRVFDEDSSYAIIPTTFYLSNIKTDLHRWGTSGACTKKPFA